MKIDKNNWCINLKEAPDGEIKELFKQWFIKNCGYNVDFDFDYNYAICINSILNRTDYLSQKEERTLITIDQWYNEIYLNGQTAQSVDEKPITVKYEPVVTIADLQQLEERLTKLIEEKLNVSLINERNKFESIDIEQFRELKPEQPKPIWETHPDWESCATERDRYVGTHIGGIYKFYSTRVYCSISEAHAKRQVAEIKLMEIAEKWNEGVEIKNEYTYLPYPSNSNLYIATMCPDTVIYNICPFSFNSKELAKKSIELHKELWMDYFLINNQNK